MTKLKSNQDTLITETKYNNSINEIKNDLSKFIKSMTEVDVPIVIKNDGKIPVYKHATDSGCDLYTTKGILIESGVSTLIPTGVHIKIPLGYEVTVRGRSGFNTKTNLDTKFGTVDSGYTGDIGVAIYYNESSLNRSLSVLGSTIDDDEFNEYLDHFNDRVNDDNDVLSQVESNFVNDIIKSNSYFFNLLHHYSNFKESALNLQLDHSYLYVPKGTRIAQIVCSKVIKMNFNEVDSLESTDRGNNGFGSTGTKL